MNCKIRNGKRICKYPLTSSSRQINIALQKGNHYIKTHVSKSDLKLIREVARKSETGDNSLKKCLKKDGTLKKSCENFHSEIINNELNKVNSDRKDPDLYIMGGIPGSGKTTVLRKFIPEKTVLIDSDEFKEKLSKNYPSKSKRFKLIHASLLHNQADVLVAEAINKAIRTKKNVTVDMTFGNLMKGNGIIKQFRKAGYDIHYLGTQKYPHKSIPYVAERFIEKGRYVPLEYVAEKGNKISKNSWKARKLADSYIIYDTNKKPGFVVTKSKVKINENVRDP